MKTKRIVTLFFAAIVAFVGVVGCDEININEFIIEEETTSTETTAVSNGSFTYFSSKEEAIAALNSLTVAEADESVNYDRDEYGDWAYTSGTNTRFQVLVNSGDAIVEDNKIVGGTWYIAYTGETVTYTTKEEVSNNLQIDHIVPVSYANSHGAASWDQDKKEEFYNDYGQETAWTTGSDDTVDYAKVCNLIVSDRSSNLSKSDSGPSGWMPSNEDYWVEYCESWVVICSNYGISIDQADYDKILEVFESVVE